MSNPYPRHRTPKRLIRSTSNRVIGGVCGGVAEYLNMDANLVRILTVLISLFTGVPVILYIIALFVMPGGHHRADRAPPVTGAPTYPGPFSATEASTPPPAYAPTRARRRNRAPTPRTPSGAARVHRGSSGSPTTTAPPRPLPPSLQPRPRSRPLRPSRRPRWSRPEDEPSPRTRESLTPS